MRKYEIKRKTKETDISLSLDIDGSGESTIDTGIGFLDHMLTLFASHGLFNLAVSCKGDLSVDCHHSAEDIGICLGQAFNAALGDKRGITRYADIILPMDEALVLASADISGRAMLCFDLPVPSKRIGTFDTELVEEFLIAFVSNAKITLHIKKLRGRNTHHIIEACFKALGRVLDKATMPDPRRDGVLPSTKGML